MVLYCTYAADYVCKEKAVSEVKYQNSNFLHKIEIFQDSLFIVSEKYYLCTRFEEEVLNRIISSKTRTDSELVKHSVQKVLYNMPRW